ncbi:MAG TPA: LysM peptidoglycan-binding domain-containing protein [Candidatus Saccharimonadales bacterium]
MRKIAAIAVTLALFIIPVASIHTAGAEPAQSAQNQKPTTVAAQPAAGTTPTPAPVAAPSPVTVTVQPGDTLSGIATGNNTTYERIYDANSFIADPNLIYPGQQVRIPDTSEQLADRAAPTPTVVTVQSGETLNSIATDNGTTAQRLYDANTFISDPNVIHPGEQVAIPTSDEQLTDRSLPVPTAPAPAVAPARATAQAAAPQPVTRSVAPAVTATTAATASTGTPDNAAKAYIYAHESSNNPNATNAEGCYGLGQDCSGKLKPMCGSDYACQDAFFDNYAQQRYGGWANAQAFWEAHHWW